MNINPSEGGFPPEKTLLWLLSFSFRQPTRLESVDASLVLRGASEHPRLNGRKACLLISVSLLVRRRAAGFVPLLNMYLWDMMATRTTLATH